jgi:Retrotransposon gag protein
VKERALEVLRSSLLLYAPNPTHTLIYNMLVAAFQDMSEEERALQKLQSLTQKGDIEVYIREFNTLRGLAASVATLDPNAVLRYFVQGLRMNIRIRTAAAVLAIVEAAQVVARTMDLVLGGQHDGTKDEPMNTSIGQQDEKPKKTCNWCGYKSHFECECRQKAGGKPRKVFSSSTPNIS